MSKRLKPWSGPQKGRGGGDPLGSVPPCRQMAELRAGKSQVAGGGGRPVGGQPQGAVSGRGQPG